MSFAENFWSQDYTSGFQILFKQLKEGINEDNDFINLFKKRMESEFLYGSSLQSIQTDLKPLSKRQYNDDYVSTIKNSFSKLQDNFSKQGEYHLNIADNIENMVLKPFEKWASEHEERVDYSNTILNSKYKKLKNLQIQADKIQKKYFNKCRLLEEFKNNYTEEELNEETNDADFHKKINGNTEEEEEEVNNFEFTQVEFNTLQVQNLISEMLNGIPKSSHKVAILGTYQNVSTGSSITQWVLDNVSEIGKNLEKAEKFGQDLINNNFIKNINPINKTFINSSQFYYQWKPEAFALAQIKPQDQEETQSFTKSFGQFNLDDMKEAIGVNSIDYNDISQYPRLVKEVENLDLQYFNVCQELDQLRCEFEEVAMDHLTFMQKCELDRLKAIKKVTYDFIASFYTNTNRIQDISQELILIEETINPKNDLKFLIENYSTGYFKPKVTLYDNYYESNIKQTFGVDLNVKSRLDKKIVPILIQCILSHLDHVYPELTDDQERINLWTQPVHLTNTHELRSQLNGLDNPNKINEILVKTNPIVITNVLKLYLLELPDSLIPNSFYDVIKLLYLNYNETKQKEVRINGLQNVLSELPKCNLATLDSLLTHLKRLIQIIGSKNKDASANLQQLICFEFGKLILRPKFESHNNADTTLISSRQYLKDKHPSALVRDLIDNKETIFNELRRISSTRSTSSNSSIPSKSNSNSSSNKQSTNQELSPTESLAARSKSRLESRLKSAVKHNKEQHPPQPAHDQPELQQPKTRKQASQTVVETIPVQPIDEKENIKPKSSSSTPPPPPTPTKSPISLKRSTSPKKKRLSSMLLDDQVVNTNGSSDSLNTSKLDPKRKSIDSLRT
ncbi:rga8 [Candida pseudojiufengensis]|uniref:rga8 n=1 Tax=Candida pseudojiufengensis TaxID=497109 RepID=UPI0022255522|nr:rga8 [Candida pseudojiufengensis]KAI5962654.1 rga8 [Candida pseudojiufengensis]